MPPIFDFECTSCGNKWESVVLSNSDNVDKDKIPTCPKCKSMAKKLVGGKGLSFRLYGEGFHNRTHKDTGEFSG